MFSQNNSLVYALDEFNESILNHSLHSDGYYDSLVEMICTKQLHSGEMSGTFDPGPKKLREGIRLFTGERVRTKPAIRNIVSLEAGRALVVAGSSNATTRSAIARLNAWLQEQCFRTFCEAGECRHSTIALLRYAASGGIELSTSEVDTAISVLREHRDGNGRWKGYPFYYTLLALLGLDTASSKAELDYALPACERALRLNKGNDSIALRRMSILRSIKKRGESKPQYQTTLRDLWVV